MQIEVVDDSSSDDVESIVRSFGRGRVGFHRHETRRGHLENFQACLERSRGDLIHLLHGDDLVHRGFYQALQAGFEAAPEIGAAFCRSEYIDPSGRYLSAPEPEQPKAGRLGDAVIRLASQQRIMTPSIAVRRSVYESLGGFDARLKCSEDWEMWVRIAAHYAIWYEPRVLSSYRMHPDSNTGRHSGDASTMKYTRLAIELFLPQVPASSRAQVALAARTTYANTCVDDARTMLRQGRLDGCFAHLREALLLRPSMRIAARAVKLLLREGLARARSRC